MKKLALVFLFLLSICAVTSCGFLGSGMDPDDGVKPYPYTFVTKTHAPLLFFVTVQSFYDSITTASFYFSGLKENLEKVVDGVTYYANDFEYTFVSDGTRQKVKSGVYAYPKVHDDGHVYFSLFDETGGEKGYDVDLSETIHSWTRRGDSVDVVLPAYIDTMTIMETKEGNFDYNRCYLGESLPNRTKTISYEQKWNPSYDFSGWLNGQSSYGTDSIYVLAYIYWRPYNL